MGKTLAIGLDNSRNGDGQQIVERHDTEGAHWEHMDGGINIERDKGSKGFRIGYRMQCLVYG